MSRVSVRVVTVAAAATAAIVITAAAHAHHSNLMFDMTAPVWIEGTVVSYSPVNPHTLLEIDVAEGGGTRRWTVEGPFIAALKRMGADEHVPRPGAFIQVCGFSFKEKFGLQAATAGGFDASRFVHGHVLVLADGRLKAWGPYGKIDNCVRPGDDPQRWVELLRADARARAAWCDKARTAIPTRAEVRELVTEINREAGDVCVPRPR